MMIIEKEEEVILEVDLDDIGHHAHRVHIVVSMVTTVVESEIESTTEREFHVEMTIVIIEVVVQAVEEKTTDEEFERIREEIVIEGIVWWPRITTTITPTMEDLERDHGEQQHQELQMQMKDDQMI